MRIIIAVACLILLSACAKQEPTATSEKNAGAHNASALAAPVKIVTPEEWKAALLSTYDESKVEDKGEGVTEFMAKFKLPEGVIKNVTFGERDAFRKLRFYTVGFPTNVSTGVKAYISLPDNKRPHLFLQPYYWGHDWIFMEKVSILVEGELVFERDCPKPDRDTQGVGVKEQCDILLEPSEIDSLRKINDASKVAIRMTGAKGYATVKKDGYNPLKFFVQDIQSGIAVFDLLDSTLKDKVPDLKKT